MVFSECRDGEFKRSTLEALGVARRIADGCGGSVDSVALGSQGDEVIDVIMANADGLPSNALSVLFFEHMGGAVGRVGVRDTAFANRDARYNFTILSGWPDPAEDDRHIAWTRAFGDAMKALATGAGYVNYMTDDEGSARIRATYEINYDRLVAVKRKYDPTNFFSGNQNIAP